MHQHYFYVSPDKINENTALLTGDEFRHCIQVLRKRKGDEVALIDGQGNIYLSLIETVNKSDCLCRILSNEFMPRLNKTDIWLGFGLVKTKALELIIRDATALGVTGIIPILTKNAVKQKLNLDRAGKIAVESIKQSGNFYVPILSEPLTLNHWFKTLPTNCLKIICEQDSQSTLYEILEHKKSFGSVAILIGPEGDFHPDEFKMALDAGFISVKLSPYRFRTELAVISAVASVNSYLYQGE